MEQQELILLKRKEAIALLGILGYFNKSKSKGYPLEDVETIIQNVFDIGDVDLEDMWDKVTVDLLDLECLDTTNLLFELKYNE